MVGAQIFHCLQQNHGSMLQLFIGRSLHSASRLRRLIEMHSLVLKRVTYYKKVRQRPKPKQEKPVVLHGAGASRHHVS